MALLWSNVDPVLICLQGRWKSWTMIRYLHRSATDTSDFATKNDLWQYLCNLWARHTPKWCAFTHRFIIPPTSSPTHPRL
jgi:hypothetical protein